jgi:hypothetical protein
MIARRAVRGKQVPLLFGCEENAAERGIDSYRWLIYKYE